MSLGGMDDAFDHALEEENTVVVCPVHGKYIAGWDDLPCPKCEDGEDENMGENNE